MEACRTSIDCVSRTAFLRLPLPSTALRDPERSRGVRAVGEGRTAYLLPSISAAPSLPATVASVSDRRLKFGDQRSPLLRLRAHLVGEVKALSKST